MRNDRDSSGGYLTGHESERLWDAREEDAYAADQVDDEEDLDPNDDEPIEAVWARAFAVAAEIRANDRAIGRLRNPAIFDPEDRSIEELEAHAISLANERSDLEYQMAERGLPPRGWSPGPPAPIQQTASRRRQAPPGPSTRPEAVLGPRLTPAEYQQWEWLNQGVNQVEVARRLGISQVAVSKREKKLRARIDAVYTEATGHPYHWTPIPKPQGGRRRRS